MHLVDGLKSPFVCSAGSWEGSQMSGKESKDKLEFIRDTGTHKNTPVPKFIGELDFEALVDDVAWALCTRVSSTGTIHRLHR